MSSVSIAIAQGKNTVDAQQNARGVRGVYVDSDKNGVCDIYEAVVKK